MVKSKAFYTAIITIILVFIQVFMNLRMNLIFRFDSIGDVFASLLSFARFSSQIVMVIIMILVILGRFNRRLLYVYFGLLITVSVSFLVYITILHSTSLVFTEFISIIFITSLIVAVYLWGREKTQEALIIFYINIGYLGFQLSMNIIKGFNFVWFLPYISMGIIAYLTFVFVIQDELRSHMFEYDLMPEIDEIDQ